MLVYESVNQLMNPQEENQGKRTEARLKMYLLVNQALEVNVNRVPHGTRLFSSSKQK